MSEALKKLEEKLAEIIESVWMLEITNEQALVQIKQVFGESIDEHIRYIFYELWKKLPISNQLKPEHEAEGFVKWYANYVKSLLTQRVEKKEEKL